MTPSAVGERQMLPMQTKRMRTTRKNARFMDMGLSDKVCVVTGASSGIGLATGEEARGGRAGPVGRRAMRRSWMSRPRGLGGEYIAVDVTDLESDERIVATCAEQMGGIDVLVNNAGTSYIRRLDELTDDEWRDAVRAERAWRRCG